jgi:hypothetical protein
MLDGVNLSAFDLVSTALHLSSADGAIQRDLENAVFRFDPRTRAYALDLETGDLAGIHAVVQGERRSRRPRHRVPGAMTSD